MPVDAALRRALARLPADRFQSAEEMAQALRPGGTAGAGAGTRVEEAEASPARGGGLSIWQEMRRRKVWSAALIYGSGWAASIGFAASVKELVEISESTSALLARAVIGVGAAGLPLTIALAWMFEIGREGKLRRTGAWKTAGLRGSPAWPLLTRGAVVAVTAVLAGAAVWFLVLRPLLARTG
ncbi:MAG: hypothetical protein R6X22_08355 [Gemmatimonadota bacterium]